MALNDSDRTRTTGTVDTRNSTGYMPYIVAAVILAAGLFYFFGDEIRARTTSSPTVTSAPQTTTPSPATK